MNLKKLMFWRTTATKFPPAPDRPRGEKYEAPEPWPVGIIPGLPPINSTKFPPRPSFKGLPKEPWPEPPPRPVAKPPFDYLDERDPADGTLAILQREVLASLKAGGWRVYEENAKLKRDTMRCFDVYNPESDPERKRMIRVVTFRRVIPDRNGMNPAPVGGVVVRAYFKTQDLCQESEEILRGIVRAHLDGEFEASVVEALKEWRGEK